MGGFKANKNFINIVMKKLNSTFEQDKITQRCDIITKILTELECYLALCIEFDKELTGADIMHDFDLIIEVIEHGPLIAKAVHEVNSTHHCQIFGHIDGVDSNILSEIIDLESKGAVNWTHLNAYASIETMRGDIPYTVLDTLNKLGIDSTKKRKYKFTRWNTVADLVLTKVLTEFIHVIDEYISMKDKYGTDTAIEALYDTGSYFRK